MLSQKTQLLADIARTQVTIDRIEKELEIYYDLIKIKSDQLCHLREQLSLLKHHQATRKVA